MDSKNGIGKRNRRVTPLGAVNIGLLALVMLVCVYPMYFIFINSISDARALAGGVYLLPQNITLEAYVQLKTIQGIGSGILMSVARTVIGSLLTMLCSSFVAYLLTYRDMPAKTLFYRFFIITMYVNAGFIPYYLVISGLGLKNNFLVYVLPSAVSAYFMILVKTYIESMPASLRESAEIDGAGILTVYVQIILPLAKPILACIVVFAAVNQWNAWSDDMFFMQGSRARNLHVLQYLLYKKLQSSGGVSVSGSTGSGAAIAVTPMSLRMAMTFVSMLPILCVYPFMQRYFTKGIMLGAVKG